VFSHPESPEAENRDTRSFSMVRSVESGGPIDCCGLTLGPKVFSHFHSRSETKGCGIRWLSVVWSGGSFYPACNHVRRRSVTYILPHSFLDI
jgi:hypothetical protein